MRLLILLLAAMLVATSARAQEQDAQMEPRLTPELAAELSAFHNAPTTSRFSGTVRISAETRLSGDVSVLDGTLLLDGTVEGSVLVINGSAVLAAGSSVGADLVVVGGEVRGDSSVVSGDLLVVPEALRYRRSGDSITVVIAREEPAGAVRAGRQFGFGRTDVLVAARGYNRVEGLPLAVGPRLQIGRSNPTVGEALLLYRSESGISPSWDELGYELRLEQYLGGHGRFSVGAALESLIEPIEETGVSDLESSLATFLLHQDYRDYYERSGWSAFAEWRDVSRSLLVRAELVDEEHESRAAGDPPTLFDADEPFRPQPLVATGTLTSLRLSVEHDSRNDMRDPSSGWWIRTRVEQGLGGELLLPISPLPPGGIEEAPAPVDEEFSTLLVDLRRYARLGPHSRVALRVLAAGSLDGDALPPQRQHTLGGEGTLPGYSLFEIDCGARDVRFTRGNETFFGFYGCDRALLFQVDYELSLPFIGPLGRYLGWDLDFGSEPAVSLFVDAGRAWNELAARGGRGAGPDDFVADAGIGVRLGRVGLYLAAPLSGREDGVNFFVRLGPRL